MPTTERLRDRGALRGDRWLDVIGAEFRRARRARGLSQQRVANAVSLARSTYSLVERAKLKRLSVHLAATIAAVLGLDLFVALYPGPSGLRDEAHALLIHELVSHVGPPLRYRTEVPLRGTARPDQRSWDLQLTGHGERTALEFEMRLCDAQDQLRRHNLKRRDDPVDHFVLVLADTRRNREALALAEDLFADLPRLRTATVLRALRAGQHPPTGYMLLSSRPPVGKSDDEGRGPTSSR